MKYIVGIDEAGRGPLAGPVAVGVVLTPGSFDWESKLPGVTDSKQLSEKKREEFYLRAKELKKVGELDFAVSMVSAKVIDTVGILLAINLALNRALKQLETRHFAPFPRVTLGKEVSSRQDLELVADEVMVKLDGGLRAPKRFINQETIIKGDASEPVIGLASIMAKVTRDRYMVRKAALPLFAPYGFHIHKGYGTKVHRAAIDTHGLTELHRRSYCKNSIVG